jgi:uncharacterized membrane protein
MSPVSPRHHEVTRIEGFSDAVFGFALTLLVVSLETPKNMEGLRAQVQGFVPFALMFAMVCYLWWEHNKFFRRFGLQDAWTAFLNCVLLFVLLFYVYPLKYLTLSLLGRLLSLPGAPEMGDGRELMLLYNAGVVLIFGTFVLLYRHAWSSRETLGLSPDETLALRFGLRAHMLSLSLGVVSIAMVLVHRELIPFAGFIYMLMGPLHGLNGMQLARAQKRQAAAPAPPPHAKR